MNFPANFSVRSPFSKSEFHSLPFYHFNEQRNVSSALAIKGSHLDFLQIELLFIALILLLYFFIKNYISIQQEPTEFEDIKVKAKKPKNRIKNLPRVSPTPFGIPQIDGIVNVLKWSSAGVEAFEEWSAKYGSIFELPLHVEPTIHTVVTEPHIIQKILCSSEPQYLNKPRGIYKAVMPKTILDGLVGSDVERWSQIKKAVAPIFTYKSLLSYIPFMNTHASHLVKCLDDLGSNGIATGDGIYDLIYGHTIKVIMDILLGPKNCDDERGMKFHQNVKRGKEIIKHQFQHPILTIPFIWWFHPLKWEFEGMVNGSNEYFQELINYHRENGKNMEKFGMKDEKTPVCLIKEMIRQGVPDKEICNTVEALFIPGHETTTMSINFTLFLLAKNVKCLELCQKEIDNIFSNKATSDVYLNMDDVQNLKYLERCIYESLRILPVIPLFARRLDKSLKIDEETEFEAGSAILISPWLMHHDPNNFPNPDKYDPDRFLPEIAEKRHPGSYFPFSRGSRNCIGWKLALVEMKIMLAYILRNFDPSSTDDMSSLKINQVLTLEMERYYQLSLKKRNV